MMDRLRCWLTLQIKCELKANFKVGDVQHRYPNFAGLFRAMVKF